MPHKRAIRCVLTCEECGVSFERRHCDLKKPNSGRFCCRVCQFRNAGNVGWNTNHVIVPCESCGADIRSTPSHPRRFCSKPCAANLRRLITGSDHPGYIPRVTRLCDWCKQPYEVRPVRLTQGLGMYCSKACNGHAQIYALRRIRVSGLEISFRDALDRRGLTYEHGCRIGRWNVDFYLPDFRLVVECDGDYWHSFPDAIVRDKRKTDELITMGYRVIRLPEWFILRSPDRAAKAALRAIGVEGQSRTCNERGRAGTTRRSLSLAA
jgi:very-short-patch-repair endonuclease